MSLLLLFLLHIFCVVLVWLGIRSGILKVKKYLMPVVLFVPIWGVLCVLILHFQVGFGKDGSKDFGAEKLRINEEIYRSIFVEQEEQKNVVPLEEALIINRPGLRRNLIMDVLNDDPEEYIDLLQQARMNEDAEVVHYAATAMAEVSKEHEFRLQKLERAYLANPDDEALLDAYCDFLKDYIGRGLVQGQMERMQRRQYSQLLMKKLQAKAELETCVELAENQLTLGEYDQVEKTLALMAERWQNREEYWLLKLRCLAQQRRGRELTQLLSQMEEQHIYLSAKGRDVLAFWRQEESGQDNQGEIGQEGGAGE